MRKVEILPQTDFWGSKYPQNSVIHDQLILTKAENLREFPQKYAWNSSTQKVSDKFQQFWFTFVEIRFKDTVVNVHK